MTDLILSSLIGALLLTAALQAAIGAVARLNSSSQLFREHLGALSPLSAAPNFSVCSLDETPYGVKLAVCPKGVFLRGGEYNAALE